jgi:hypothetical protein
MALSLVAWAIGRAGWGGAGVTLTLLAMMVLKGQLVGDYFMELRHVRLRWRLAIAGYLLVVGALIATAFILSAQGGSV